MANGECEAAQVSAVFLMLRPGGHIYQSLAGMLSPTGRCYTFDTRANGFMKGEACVAAVMQPAATTLAHGAPQGELAGHAVMSDGRSASLTAPNGQAQQRLLAAALGRAALTPHMVDFEEAHGTGTQLGDPTEMASLAVVLLQPRARAVARVTAARVTEARAVAARAMAARATARMGAVLVARAAAVREVRVGLSAEGTARRAGWWRRQWRRTW